jgi:hypothetical protein
MCRYQVMLNLYFAATCRQILKKIVDTKTAMGENLRAAAFALTEAKYAAGDFRHTVFDNVDQPTVKVPQVAMCDARHGVHSIRLARTPPVCVAFFSTGT